LAGKEKVIYGRVLKGFMDPLSGDDLNRHVPVQINLMRPVNLTHAPPPGDRFEYDSFNAEDRYNGNQICV